MKKELEGIQNKLNNDIWYCVFEILLRSDLYHLSRTCKEMSTLINSFAITLAKKRINHPYLIKALQENTLKPYFAITLDDWIQAEYQTFLGIDSIPITTIPNPIRHSSTITVRKVVALDGAFKLLNLKYQNPKKFYARNMTDVDFLKKYVFMGGSTVLTTFENYRLLIAILADPDGIPYIFDQLQLSVEHLLDINEAGDVDDRSPFIQVLRSAYSSIKQSSLPALKQAITLLQKHYGLTLEDLSTTNYKSHIPKLLNQTSRVCFAQFFMGLAALVDALMAGFPPNLIGLETLYPFSKKVFPLLLSKDAIEFLQHPKSKEWLSSLQNWKEEELLEKLPLIFKKTIFFEYVTLPIIQTFSPKQLKKLVEKEEYLRFFQVKYLQPNDTTILWYGGYAGVSNRRQKAIILKDGDDFLKKVGSPTLFEVALNILHTKYEEDYPKEQDKKQGESQQKAIEVIDDSKTNPGNKTIPQFTLKKIKEPSAAADTLINLFFAPNNNNVNAFLDQSPFMELPLTRDHEATRPPILIAPRSLPQYVPIQTLYNMNFNEIRRDHQMQQQGLHNTAIYANPQVPTVMYSNNNFSYQFFQPSINSNPPPRPNNGNIPTIIQTPPQGFFMLRDNDTANKNRSPNNGFNNGFNY